MAKRPWVLPEEVKAYTEQKEIMERAETKLEVDIARAELKVIAMTNNHFPEKEYPKVPEKVKLAVLLLAEAYAKHTVEQAKKQIKSETFDEYSYTLESSKMDIASLEVEALLKEFLVAPSSGTITMHLRRL